MTSLVCSSTLFGRSDLQGFLRNHLGLPFSFRWDFSIRPAVSSTFACLLVSDLVWLLGPVCWNTAFLLDWSRGALSKRCRTCFFEVRLCALFLVSLSL